MFGWKPGSVFKQHVLVTIANFTSFHIGLSVAWLSPVMVLLRNENQTVLPKPLTQEEMSWIVSISGLFDLFAFGFSGYLINTIGRKYSMILACVPRLIMCILFIFTSHVWMLICGRAICGLSDAFIVSATSSYASEIASKELRGSLGTITQVWSALGTMIMLSIGPFVSFNAINVIHTTIIVVTCLPLFFLPESPYFLYSKGHPDKATELLTSLRDSKISVHQELNDYSIMKHKINKTELLKDKTALKSLAKVICIAMCSQLTGYTFMTFYLQTIFEMTNTSVSSSISSVIMGILTLLASFCTMRFSDRFGKKPVLRTSLLAQAVGLVGLGTFFKMTEANHGITGYMNYLPLISIALAIFSYSSGLGSLMWMLFAELFDGPLRAFGISSGVFVVCLFGFLTVNQLNSIIKIFGIASTFWICAGFCIVTLLFIHFFVPETKGKSFLEIQDELRNKPARINVI